MRRTIPPHHELKPGQLARYYETVRNGKSLLVPVNSLTPDECREIADELRVEAQAAFLMAGLEPDTIEKIHAALKLAVDYACAHGVSTDEAIDALWPKLELDLGEDEDAKEALLRLADLEEERRLRHAWGKITNNGRSFHG
jgi:hypothetical protein